MHQSYPDLLERISDPPKWWDEHGVPRYQEHHPNLCPDIYADEVALLVIACQCCGQEFRVQMSWAAMDSAMQMARSGSHGYVRAMLERAWTAIDGEIARRQEQGDKRALPEVFPEVAADRTRFTELHGLRPDNLAEQITRGKVHYGDPPSTGCCPAGDTMNCWDLRVVEYWARSFTLRKLVEPTSTSSTMSGAEHSQLGWTRVPTFEIELPDATDSDRRTT